ncbi:MAG: SCO2524 family protein [Micromonosporaceae bacterium]
MRIRPRQQLLEIWKSLIATSYADGKWTWGGRTESDSVGDAEQLLCLLTPAREIEAFRFSQPDETADDVLRALRELGDPLEIPRRVVEILTDYLDRHSDEDGTPRYSGGGHLMTPPGTEPTEAQRSLDLVESFSLSVPLCLAIVTFARDFRSIVKRPDLLNEVQRLEQLASRRLTGAMTGLLRSFTVNTFDVGHPYGKILLATVNQTNQPVRRVADQLQRALRDITANLRDMTIGSGVVKDFDTPGKLYEIGWSWGVVAGAPPIDFVSNLNRQRDGVALDAPYLHFTVSALDGISDLFRERTRRLGLLNEEQQRLAQALQVRWDITQRYWAVLASFGEERWPLEDIPWRTTDDVESDYFSLLVTAIAQRDLVERRVMDVDLSRLGRVLTELGNRGRLTRRPTPNDPAASLHDPGIRMGLDIAAEAEVEGPPLAWVAPDFGALLLKRAVRTAELLSDVALRGEILELSDQLWTHLTERQMGEGAAGRLWDQPRKTFPSIETWHTAPSWTITLRAVEALVTAATMLSGRPLHSARLTAIAEDLLSEAEHLFDQELLTGGFEGGPAMREVLGVAEANLGRAKEILREKPGSAIVLAGDVLRELDRLAAAREDAMWVR